MAKISSYQRTQSELSTLYVEITRLDSNRLFVSPAHSVLYEPLL